MNDYQFLKKIKRHKKYDYDRASVKEQDALIRLLKSDYVTYEITGNDSNSRYMYSITTLGENYVYEETKMFVHWLIPTVISFISLALSMLSILIQFR